MVRNREVAYGRHVRQVEDGNLVVAAIHRDRQAALSVTRKRRLCKVATGIGDGSPYKGNGSGAWRANPHVQSYALAMDRVALQVGSAGLQRACQVAWRPRPDGVLRWPARGAAAGGRSWPGNPAGR